jgi:hypothetical protein
MVSGSVQVSKKYYINNDSRSLFSCTLIFYFHASWANSVSKKSSGILYNDGAHFIHCWNSILYIVGAHLYLMSKHIPIHCINSYPCILGRLLYIIGGRGASSLAPLLALPMVEWSSPDLQWPPTLDGVMATVWTTVASHQPLGPLLRGVGRSDGDCVASACYLTA